MMKPKNIFQNIPQDLDKELFEPLLEQRSLTIERIVSKGHQSPDSGWYDQEKNEWVMVIKGKAILIFEDEPSIQLSAGDFVNIPCHKKHRVIWTDPDNETIWLAVYY